MKRPLSSSLLVAGVLACTAFSASAQSSSAGVGVQTVTPDANANFAPRDVRDYNCLHETGSHVTTARNQQALRDMRTRQVPTATVTCNGYGRSYTQDDLRSTGAVDTADALRRLDPSIH